MRIAHGDKDASNFTKSDLDGKLVPHLRLAHRGFKFVARLAPRGQYACLQPRIGADNNFFFFLLSTNIGSNTSGAVAGDFRFRSIRVEQARSYVSLLVWKNPLHTIRTDTLMPVANAAAEISQVCRSMHAVNDQEIIATGMCFHKRNNGRRRSHAEG